MNGNKHTERNVQTWHAASLRADVRASQKIICGHLSNLRHLRAKKTKFCKSFIIKSFITNRVIK